MVKQREDLRLIEAGFPCHQVGAETQWERDTGKAPPTHRLHVWWARRPLTPSRAAVLASLLPAGTDTDWFLRQLGIEKVQAMVNGVPWTLTGQLLTRIKTDKTGAMYVSVDNVIIRALEKEQERRRANLETIHKLCNKAPELASHPVIVRWKEESSLFQGPWPQEEKRIPVQKVTADPAHINERIAFRKSERIKKISGNEFKWDNEDLYCYDRAFSHHSLITTNPQTILDPTSGGGSIPFEALRLGHKVIANELNPVATVILYATLNYPARYGKELISDIQQWGERLIEVHNNSVSTFFQDNMPLPKQERYLLEKHLDGFPNLVHEYDVEEIMDYLYARQVTCPHCSGEAPLLNTCWLSKEGEKWGVKIVPDGRSKGGKVHFETYRLQGNRGPDGEDPNFATISSGTGTCIHCRQAIPSAEIKAQARGESPHGSWQDRLYCVVAIRYQPKLDKNGKPQRYRTGPRAGEIKTEKVRFFRPPNKEDLQALAEAEKQLHERWGEWEQQGLIPTENIPTGHKTMEPLRVGMTRWCDMFTPRQLLGHLTLVDELNRLKPQILEELGEERGRAVVTYLQFMIDKCVDYNSKQTRWIPQRASVSGSFGRHDYSLKWTFGEIIYSGENSAASWGLSQITDAFKGIADLVNPLFKKLNDNLPPITILHGTAAKMNIPDNSVDLVCIDPPYYNNVQYAELSDFYYVWQRRTLKDLYPSIFNRRLTNKTDEAVANPSRDGSAAEGAHVYQRMMGEIFAECSRVLKNEGIMTIMFTHKEQSAWEALTISLIDNGWTITSSFPVESEFSHSQHILDNASASSSIFLTCRKRIKEDNLEPSTWSGFGGIGVAGQVRAAVRQGLDEFTSLQLNAVDEMVASYGRALHVLSENWPVLDGDEAVSPMRAMNEASGVVAQHQIERITQGRLKVEELNPEGAMALTLYGIFSLGQFPYDQALNLSRSLNIKLESRSAGYNLSERMIGINDERPGRGNAQRNTTESGFHAPLLRNRGKLRLALPEERNSKRLENPQTEWDVLHGLIMSYREGDAPVARAYLERHGGAKQQLILDLLYIWTEIMADEDLQREGKAILYGLQ